MFFKDVYGTSILAIDSRYYCLVCHLQNAIWSYVLRAVGEHPMAADTMGVNVTKMRYIAVILSGALAGIGGAVYSQSISGEFSHCDD